MKPKTMLLAVAAFVSTTMLAFDADTFGFYSFKDGTSGASALGSSANDVAGSSLNAVTIKGSNATFMDQRPGKYVYGSASASEPIAVEPLSVHIVGGGDLAEHAGSELSFANAGSVISQHHATGFTIEFFMLMQPDDPWFKFSTTIYLPCGYKDLADNTCKSMLMMLPRSADFEYFVGYSSADKDVYSSRKKLYPSTFCSGVWRHVAFVEKPEGDTFRFQVYLDRVLSYDYKFNKSQVVATTLSSGGDFRLGAGSLTATISCVRFTKRALTTGEFMVVSDREPVPAGDGAFGFYSFADQEPGTSAVGAQIANDVHPLMMSGSVTLDGDATINPYATFDVDAPGQFILDGEAGAVICENPRSLKVGSDAVESGKGGTLTIADVGTELSKHHANGHTIEYFYKLDGKNCNGYALSMGVNAGYMKADTSATSELRLYAPYSNGNVRRNGCCLDYYGDGENPYRVNVTVVRPPNDGYWHHVALVETSDRFVEYYYDHELCGSFALGNVVSVTTSNPFRFFADNLQGKISCIRFTDHQLGPEQFLCALDRIPDPVRQTDVVAFYAFKDGAKGTSAAGAQLVDSVHPSHVPGAVTLSGQAGANATAVFDDDCPGAVLYGGEEYPETPFATNPGSIALDSDLAGYSGTIRFPTMAKTLYGLHGTGFTIEFFFKVSDDRMLEWDPNIQVCAGYVNGETGLEAPFNIALPCSVAGAAYRYGFGYDESEGLKTSALPAPLWDGKWHHFAYVETPVVDTTQTPATTNWSVSVWVDRQCAKEPYEIRDTVQSAGAIGGDLMHLALCRDKNHAKFSCLKVTARPLAKSEFMRTKPRYHGTAIIIR